MKKLFDTHTHSDISDGGNSPAEMFNAAAAKGLEFMVLTDHFDIHGQFPAPLSRFDGAGREESYKNLCGVLSDLPPADCRFLKGVEIGQAHHYKQIAENWLNGHDYDYVIASCHMIRGHRDFYHIDYTENSPEMLTEQYFTELTELCSWGGIDRKFDSLAHLSYPLRYMGENKADLNNHKAAIDELFKVMVKYDIALEINTAKTEQFRFCPEFPQVKRYYELGGRLITVGSDAHNTDSIAYGVADGVQMAKKAGFTECAYYEKRELKFIAI